MWTNYLKVALRTLRRQQGYTCINVFGLALGLTCCLLIALYVRHELTYDRFHEHADRVYRVVVDRHYADGRVRRLAPTSPPLAPGLEHTVPAVERAARLFVPRYTTGRALLRHEDRAFYEPRFFYADPDVFEVLSFPLREGDPTRALRDPRSVVVSETTARKYFGEDDPVGQTLVLDDSLSLTVAGVMRDMPSNAHLHPDFLAPYALLEHQYGARARTWWGWDLVYTYVLLDEGHAPRAALPEIQAYLDAEARPRTMRRGYNHRAHLQPLPDIHLHSDREWEIEPGSSPAYPYALSIVALFILLVACINFVNLSTAQAAERAREVGVRKALGSRRRDLVLQFLCEAVLLASVAAVLGLLVAGALLPFAEPLAGARLHLTGPVVAAALLAALAVGLAAGSFPAFYLASLPAIPTLKGSFRLGGERLRKVLVTTQFAVSIVLIAGTLVAQEQLHFMRDKELGFDDEHLLALSTGALPRDAAELKDELLRRPGVEAVTATSGLPGGKIELMQVEPVGGEGAVPVQMLWVDHDFAETFGLRLRAGRDFSEAHATDAEHAYVVNETAAEMMGWDEAVGKELSWTSGWGTKRGTVVGVVEDFHTASLRERVAPLVLSITPAYQHLVLRVRTPDADALLAGLKTWWEKTAPGRPFEYVFIDDAVERLSRPEERQARVFGAFAALAVAIAAVGLFGLTAYAAERRTKEIGVRKVLGASVAGLVALLSKDFLRPVLVAFAVAAPVAYLLMQRWLEGFAYRIEISWPIFLWVGAGALAIALATVSYQAVRAALADPVESLRCE